MKITSLARTLLAASLLSAATFGAGAQTILANPIYGSSFNNILVGTIQITSPSNLAGSMFAATGIDYGPFTLSLGTVTFSSATVGSLLGDLDASAAGFSFANVAAGFYNVIASGSISGGAVPNMAFIGANYTITPVPEPESFAMLLAGLGLMGAIALRRNKSAS